MTVLPLDRPAARLIAASFFLAAASLSRSAFAVLASLAIRSVADLSAAVSSSVWAVRVGQMLLERRRPGLLIGQALGQ